MVKKEIPVRNGINQEDAKKIVKLIKDSGFKVQAAIMDDIIRVTGKKIDDLQAGYPGIKKVGPGAGVAICEYEKLSIISFCRYL